MGPVVVQKKDGAYYPGHSYRRIPRAYTRETFERFISESGFVQSEIQTAPLGFEITLFK